MWGTRRLVGLIAVVVLLAVWAKVRLEAGASLQRAQTFEEENQLELAITSYRQTIRWYSPGSAPVERATEHLIALAEASEQEADHARALLSWRALRSGLMGVRSVYQPYPDLVERSNKAIAILMAEQERDQSDGFSEEQLREREAHHRALLERDLAPSVGWSLVAVLAFGFWVWSLFAFAVRAFDDSTGRLLRTPALRWCAVMLGTMATWMTALSQA
jgi:hypothetical protein